MRLAAITWFVAVALILGQTGVTRAAGARSGNKLKGQIVVSDEVIPTFDDETKMAEILKKWKKTDIERAKDASSWLFRMMSFPSAKPGTTTLSLLFYDVSDGKRVYLTSKDISCDAAATILASEVEVSEEDGIKPGMKVELALAKISGDRQTELATARLTFK